MTRRAIGRRSRRERECRSPARIAPIGRFSRCKRPADADGRRIAGMGGATRSTRSSWPGSKPRDCRRTRRPTSGNWCGGLYYDLTGLPPTPEEVEAFAADPSPRGYEELVDRLLASPHYGEKWGRHWLDLVRYAETNSYERDNPKPQRLAISRLRHPLASTPTSRTISSSASNSPATRFRRRPPDSIIATGYYRLGIWDDEPADRELARYDGLDDIVATTGQVFLGLTVDCARCHDHKIDPIPQKDYYGCWRSSTTSTTTATAARPTNCRSWGVPRDRAAYEQAARELDKNRNRVHRAIVELDEKFRRLYLAEKKEAEKKQAEKKPDGQATVSSDKAAKKPDFGRLMQTDGERILGKENFRPTSNCEPIWMRAYSSEAARKRRARRIGERTASTGGHVRPARRNRGQHQG